MYHRHTARAVIFNHHGQLLVMERHKRGQHYFTLPGGHVDTGEAPDETVEREVLEETGLKVTAEKLIYKNVDALGNHQQIFLCQYQGGEPVLQPDSIEATKLTDQSYQPRWMELRQLESVKLYPDWLLAQLRSDQATNYRNNPRAI